MRRRLLAIPVGIIIFLMGLVWFLQGIEVLPGSIMSGSQFWAIAGGLVVIVGLVLIGIGATGKNFAHPID
ncbi:MAG: hypothetical protein ABSA92_14585 [Candidatus Bathyarchaeia archaeon]